MMETLLPASPTALSSARRLVNAMRRTRRPSRSATFRLTISRRTRSVSAPPRVAIPLTLSVRPGRRGHRRRSVRDPDLWVAKALWTGLAAGRVVCPTAGPRRCSPERHDRAGCRRFDDPDVIADYSRAAQLLSAVWGGPVHIGSVQGRDTPLGDAIDIARAYGRRVVIASYVLTPARRPTSSATRARTWSPHRSWTGRAGSAPDPPRLGTLPASRWRRRAKQLLTCERRDRR